MATKRINIMIIPESGSNPKSYRISTFRLKFALYGALGFIVGAGLLGWQYRDTLRKINQLEVVQQKYFVQKTQISSFVQDIDSLRRRINNLQKSNNKFRVIAGLSQNDNPQYLSGIGGETVNGNLTLAPESRMIKQIHSNIRNLDVMIEVEQDSLKELENTVREKKSLLASTPTIWPARGWLASGFGYRLSPFTNKREMHKGIDIATYFGSPVYATADGVITFSGNNGSLGKTVKIDHGYGYTTRYGHNSNLLVKVGDRVKRGQKVAKVGSTGRSTGPHLHYEVRLNNISVNPYNHLLD
jgi:murein DD-endopeptidase MepM/ murein hydrolase activator NlpD